MLQEQQRNDTSFGNKNGRDCAIFSLALQSLNAVKRAHQPKWPCVVRPVRHDEAERSTLSN